MKGVIHEGIRLMPNSTALRLFQEGKHKELAKHMRELDKVHQAMEGTPAEVALRLEEWRARTFKHAGANAAHVADTTAPYAAAPLQSPLR